MWVPWHCVQVFSYLWSASTAHNVGAMALCTGVFLPVVCLHCPQCGHHRAVYRCFLTCGLLPLPAMWAPWHCVQVFSYLWYGNIVGLFLHSLALPLDNHFSQVHGQLALFHSRLSQSYVTSCSCNSKLCHTAQGKQHLTMWFVIVAMTVLYTHPFKGPFPGLPR